MREAVGDRPESVCSAPLARTRNPPAPRRPSLERRTTRSALGFPRQQLSALENGHRGPDLDPVDGICHYLQVGPKRREAIIAADGWAAGWWEPDAEKMGHRQARYADLESGTRSISEYALALIPGLLQTPEFAEARTRADPARQPETFDPATSVIARTRRQQLLLATGGPVYDLELDEIAVRRCAAEPPIVAGQLRSS